MQIQKTITVEKTQAQRESATRIIRTLPPITILDVAVWYCEYHKEKVNMIITGDKQYPYYLGHGCPSCKRFIRV